MTAITFDTLKLSRRLEAAGFASRQAQDTAEALAEAMAEVSGLATKEDVFRLDARIEGAKSDVPKSVMGMIIGAIAVNSVVVLGGMIGLAKLLGH